MIQRTQLLIELARPASKICAYHFSNKPKTWNKKDSSPVTEADIAVNDLFIDAISENFPDDGILSEETLDSSIRQNTEYVWVIDPIDGTSEFIRGSKEHCIMVCLLHKNQPVFSLIAIPQENQFFYGGPGQGVYIEAIDSSFSKVKINYQNLNDNIVLLSRSHGDPSILGFINQEKLTGIPCGSAGVKVCRILTGKGAHYIHLSRIAEWDTAAPDCLMRALGINMVDINGKTLTYNKTEPKQNGLIATMDDELRSKATAYFSTK